MAMNLTDKDIYLILLQNIFSTVQTFDWQDLVNTLKDRLVIHQFASDLFLADLIVNIDSQLDSTKPITLPSSFSSNGSKENTLSSDACAYGKFVATAVNNKTSYTAGAVAEEKELTANFVWETTEVLRHKNFALQKFRLDTLWALPLWLETANAIGLW